MYPTFFWGCVTSFIFWAERVNWMFPLHYLNNITCLVSPNESSAWVHYWFMYKTSYRYLHMQHINADITDVYRTYLCQQIFLFFLNINVGHWRCTKPLILCHQIYEPVCVWNSKMIRHDVVELSHTAHIALLVWSCIVLQAKIYSKCFCTVVQYVVTCVMWAYCMPWSGVYDLLNTTT